MKSTQRNSHSNSQTAMTHLLQRCEVNLFERYMSILLNLVIHSLSERKMSVFVADFLCVDQLSPLGVFSVVKQHCLAEQKAKAFMNG